MRKIVIVILVVSLSLNIFSCAGIQKKIGDETVIETSGEKPVWITKIPVTKDGTMYFRGVRSNAPNIEAGLTDARIDAIRQVVEMTKAEVNIDYEKARIENGIPEDNKEIGHLIKDGIIMFSSAIARGIKEKESYWETVEKITQTGVNRLYTCFQLTTLSQEDYNHIAVDVIEKQISKAREENNKKAEEFLEDMKKRILNKKSADIEAKK